MKRITTILFLLISIHFSYGQSSTKIDSRAVTQNVFIKLDGSTQNGWVKNDFDNTTATPTQIYGTDYVNYYSTSEGIYITIVEGKNKVKLFALTGQLLLDGDLTQGRFFIPTHKGIYFLRINSKSFKVVCK